MSISKRYILTFMTVAILALLAIASIFQGMETVATSCVAGILTILSTYIWGETKRPSNHQKL